MSPKQLYGVISVGCYNINYKAVSMETTRKPVFLRFQQLVFFIDPYHAVKFTPIAFSAWSSAEKHIFFSKVFA